MYQLIAERTNTVIAEGTKRECQFALQAMINYGIAEERLILVQKGDKHD